MNASRNAAVSCSKVASDIRLLGSGPRTGIAELVLPAVQPGSSIMPGKVNPVIPEAVAMVAAQVIGNDATITIAGQSGNFQLNVMLPVVAFNLLQSIELLANAARVLADSAIAGFTVNKARLDEALDVVEHVAEMTVGRGHDRDADRGPLPLLLVVDLRDRDPEPVAQPVDDGPDRGPLDLERPALRDVEVEADRGRVHGHSLAPSGAGIGLLSEARGRRRGSAGRSCAGSPHSCRGRC